MPDWTSQFGVTLNAFTQLDKSSLQRAGDELKKALGTKSAEGAQSASMPRFGNRGLALLGATVNKGAAGATTFTKRIRDLKDQLQNTWHTSGLGRTVEQFRSGHQALRGFRQEFERFGKAFGPAGALVEMGSLGGLAGLTTNFGNWAQGLKNAAGNMGVSPGTLQNWQGLARLQGLGSGAATNALGQLQENLFAASRGLPEGAMALGTARRVGLDVTKGPTAFLKDLAGKMQGQLPQVQLRMARAFGVEELLPILRQGVPAIENYLEEVRKATGLSQAQIDAGDRLARSYHLATDATWGLGQAIGSQLTPTLQPLLDKWKNWMEVAKNSPGLMTAISIAGGILATMFGLTLVGAIGKLAVAMNSWWALPATRFLVAAGLTGGAMVALGLVAGNEMGQAIGDPEGYKSSMGHAVTGWAAAGHAAVGWLKGLFGGQSSGKGQSQIAPMGSSVYDAISRAEGTYGAQGIDYNKVYGGGHAPLTDMTLGQVLAYQSGMPGSTAVGGFQVLRGTLGDAASALGLSYNAKFTPETQRRVADWIKARQGFGAWEGFKTHPEELAAAQSASQANLATSPRPQWAPPNNAWLNQNAPFPTRAHPEGKPIQWTDKPSSESAPVYGPGSPFGDKPPAEANARSPFPPWIKFNSKGKAYNVDMTPQERANDAASTAYIKTHKTDWTLASLPDGQAPVPAAAGAAQLAVGAGDYQPAEPADSEHHLLVQFENAPSGMRAGLRRVRGPDEMTVRTHVAFAQP